MTINGGGIVNDMNGYIGDHGIAGKVSNGVVTVTGTGSQWNNSGLLEVGLNGNGTLNVTSGGSVTDAVGVIGANGPSTGTVTLSGSGSSFVSSQSLSVGLNGTGILNVNSGTTAAAGTMTNPGQIMIGTRGTVNVIGLGGSLVGNVTNSGTLDPVTVTNITGNYTQTGTGTTILDVEGANSYGQLDVSGNVSLGGTLDIDFTGGFKPPKGSSFDLINVGGTFNDSGLVVDLIGCGNCRINPISAFMNGQLIITTTSTPAEPETLALLAISLVAVAVFVGRMRHSLLPDLRI
jgi:T5SS/PEP-CTERM-associated repeat protein